METFSALLAPCAENSPVTGEFLSQRPVMQSFDIFFDLRLINAWVNHREAGDLRHHRAHYDVIVLVLPVDKSSYKEMWKRKIFENIACMKMRAILLRDRYVNLLGGYCLREGSPGAGLWFNIETIFPGMGISIIQIRRSWDRPISIMEIPKLVSWHLYIEPGLKVPGEKEGCRGTPYRITGQDNHKLETRDNLQICAFVSYFIFKEGNTD